MDALAHRLDDIAAALSLSIDPDRVLHEVAQQARHIVPYERLTIALLDDESGELRAAYHAGADDPSRAADELRDDWRRALEEGEPVHRRSGGGAVITVPLHGGGAAGAITAESDQLESNDEIEDVSRALAALATHAAQAIERARRVRRAAGQQRQEAIAAVAAGIAQELRNPLFGISSAAQLLRYRAREDPVVERNVGRILREAERLNTMMTDLLEYARPGATSLTPGDPDAVWDEVLEGNRGLIEKNGLTVTRARPPHPARCALAHDRLAQALAGVLINAAEAAPPGSTLTLTSRLLANRAWRCTLHNTGAAIPADVLPRAFEIFVSTKPGSTGLGLALARRIVDEHHGTIAIDSSAERGTTVAIVLPGIGTRDVGRGKAD